MLFRSGFAPKELIWISLLLIPSFVLNQHRIVLSVVRILLLPNWMTAASVALAIVLMVDLDVAGFDWAFGKFRNPISPSHLNVEGWLAVPDDPIRAGQRHFVTFGFNGRSDKYTQDF